ncbi:uncharacterized protein LOC110717112 [Chenopodium quinoa]|uniref:uncharacterized protein LOC110717112 n=1 Tax=Chenopodium quinoa TaxID=63459 RepID=UPI000B78D56B|nr:uncharacterized protein LOC110717112 [Chenopodium quinoa]
MNVKVVRSFLGHAGFYRKFIKDFSLIAKPLNDLLQKDTEFVFDDKCLEAFNKLKKALISTPIVQAPSWDLPFELMCDASDSAIGDILGQRVDKKLSNMRCLGAENFVADHLSHLEDSQIHDDGSPIEDRMFDDFLYAIEAKELPCFADLVNFLPCGEFPHSFSKNQRKKLNRKAMHYV